MNNIDFRFKDQTTGLQNYMSRIMTLPQMIVYRKSTRFH
jgi:hypothetical protein